MFITHALLSWVLQEWYDVLQRSSICSLHLSHLNAEKYGDVSNVRERPVHLLGNRIGLIKPSFE